MNQEKEENIFQKIRIFEKAEAKEIDVEFKAFHIREWNRNPIKLTTDNVYCLIMQRGL
jgi:hypothetical protein